MLKMREEWTDERLDDLNARVGELSRCMDAGFAELRKEMNGRFDTLQRMMLYFSASVIVALLGLIGGLFAVVLSGSG